MITKESTYEKAFAIKRQNLAKKQNDYNMMLNAAYASNKRLADIDNELASVGASLAITALSGDTAALKEKQEFSKALNAEKQMILKKCKVKEITYDCPLCCDTGYIGGKVCECVKSLANSILATDLSALMPLEECTFENFDLNYYFDTDSAKRRMTAILKLSKEYVLNFNPQTSQNLLFMGAPGLGKTHLTLAIVSGVIKKGYMPIYGPAEMLFSAVEKEKFQNENTGEYEQLQNCDLLVIDDLGTELVTAFTKSVLYNLINTRILLHKPTIINTNLSLKEIEEIYSPRITSRLIGNYNANKFLGKDIRQQKILGK